MRRFGLPTIYVATGVLFLTMVVKGAPANWRRTFGEPPDPTVTSVILIVGALFLFWCALTKLFGADFESRLWKRLRRLGK